MSITLIAVRNQKWVTIKDAEGNVVNDSEGNPLKVIDCECQWSHLGDNTQEWLPFSANPNDVEKHGKDLYAALVNGDHGTIADE
tara:strand:- start:182 stop:433 length:252 start_codon:yes stop_codon:yes gene_type:complete